MICPFCNKEINEDSIFCKFCGKEINNVNTQSEKKNESKEEKKDITDSVLNIIAMSFVALVILFISVPIIYEKINSPSPARYINENYNTQEQSKPEIEVLDTSFCLDDWGNRNVCGTIKNNSAYSKKAIIVNINLYDSHNNLIGNTAAVSGTLHSGRQWKFKAIVAQPNANKFEIVSISD